ncbi:membrane fusion protein, cobalt-zinc-cadmium efflux system [Sinomicrobium oceani]|uniref:Membrane fusion protein, cobalt-zinc-cadmium efflux system n=1 Tax=Sinomicrobium oceani TaxID=1150368 RepID=A0A1K1QH97_9FLAO|nr:efflux RND transporter periplasmic adaptor subunit [Sinomicrobium oceani]SFW59328.1 membrane fusion protein, cobalt-zinc-cadmium efflux system [Sinomicrobium oceani]
MKKYIAILAVAISVMVSCSEKNKTAKAPERSPVAEGILELTPEQAGNAGIEVDTPEEKEVSGIVDLHGTVVVPPQSKVNVTVPLGGYIRKTNVMSGMQVQKGHVLAVIEDMQYIQLQQDYLTAKEQFYLADKAYTRQKELNAKKASSDKLFEQVSTERETQRISMASLGRKLELLGINPGRLTAGGIISSLPIRSPVTGLVSKVNVNVGKYVSSTEMLFEVIDMKDVVFSLNAFEKDVPFIKAGQQVEVFSNSSPDKKYAAKVLYLNQSLDNDRAAEVICKPENYDDALLPGLFLNAEISIDNKKAMVLSVEGVVNWQGKSYVFESKGNDQYEMIPVETGIEHNGLREIRSERLSLTSKLVVKNAYTLLMKAMNSEEE